MGIYVFYIKKWNFSTIVGPDRCELHRAGQQAGSVDQQRLCHVKGEVFLRETSEFILEACNSLDKADSHYQRPST